MKTFELKYGCNPNQKPASIYMHDGSELPIEILNGRPGYINFLDARQKQALLFFEKNAFITSKDVEELFHFAGRTARQLLQKWVKQGFVVVADPSKKARKYKLNK